MKQEKLILFDIDGTLLVIDTLADMAFRAMTKEVYGVECSFKEISYAGMTDPRILEEVLKLRGIDDETIAAAMMKRLKNTAHTLIILPAAIPTM